MPNLTSLLDPKAVVRFRLVCIHNREEPRHEVYTQIIRTDLRLCNTNLGRKMRRDRRKVTLLKSGNRLIIDPTTPRIRHLLEPQLTFTEKEFLRGFERKIALSNHEPLIRLTDWMCFGDDHRGRIATSFGFWGRVTDTLTKAGYQVVMRDLMPPKRPEIFEPDWDSLLENFEPRHGQLQFLVKLLANPCGRFNCPTGYGKSKLIAMTAKLLPKAKIDVVSKSVSVVRDRIYPELCSLLPSVGIVGGGKSKKDCRVMVYTVGSMHHSPGDADILIGDECHEMAADQAASKFGKWDHSRNYGMSASHDMRLDNKDLRVEGIFGQIIYDMTYEEAKDHGMVVPIKIIWRPVVLDYDICGPTTDVEKMKIGIWTNDYRNSLIAKDARLYPDDAQVLIVTSTIEHAMNLKKLLPEFSLVHREDALSLEDRRRYIKQKCITPSEPILNLERRNKLTRMFEKGKLKKVICTTVWNVGVSFNHLAVLIRGDAGGSAIGDTQIPGRTSRLSAGKSVGIVHDYMDQFNSGFRRKALGREKNYAAKGWEQEYPDKPKPGSLGEQMHFKFDL